MCVYKKVFSIYLVTFSSFFVDILSLSIETSLGNNEDCFERVALGKSIPSDQVTVNRTDISLSDCEKLCLTERKCESFDYGVGARGNSSCHMSSSRTSDLQNAKKIRENTDYDLYSRRIKCELSPPSPLKPDSGGTITPKPISSTTPNYRPHFERPVYQHDKWDNYVYKNYQNNPKETYVSNTYQKPSYSEQNIAKPGYQSDDSNLYQDKPIHSQLISYSANSPIWVQESQYPSRQPQGQHEYHITQHDAPTPSYQSANLNQMNYPNNPESTQEASYSLNKPDLHNSHHETQTQQNPGSHIDNSYRNPYSNVPSSFQPTWSSLNKPTLQTEDHSFKYGTQTQQNSEYQGQTSNLNQYSNKPYLQTHGNGHPQYGTLNFQKPHNFGGYNQNLPIPDQIIDEEQTSYPMIHRPSNYAGYKRPQFTEINEIPRPISYTNDNENNKYIYDTHKQIYNFDFLPQSYSFNARPHYQNSHTFERPSENYGSEQSYLNNDVSDYHRPTHDYHRPSYFSQKHNSSMGYNSQSIYQDNYYKPHKPSYQGNDYSAQLGEHRPQSNHNRNRFRPNSDLYRPWLQQDGSLSTPNPGYNLNFNDKPKISAHLLYKPVYNSGNEPTKPALAMSSHYGTSTGTPHQSTDEDENRPDPVSYKPDDPDFDDAFDKPTTSNRPTYGTESTDVLQNVYNIHDTSQYVSQKPQTPKPNYDNNGDNFGVAQGGTYGPSVINKPQGSISQTTDSSNHWTSSHTYRPQYPSQSNHVNIYATSSLTNRPPYQSVSNPHNILYGSANTNKPQYPTLPDHESHNYGSSTNHGSPFQVVSSHMFGYLDTNRPQHTSTNRPNQQLKPVYEYEKPHATRPIYAQKPGDQVVTAGQISVDSGSSYGRPGVGVITELKPTYTTCYRRVIAGKRVLRGHVQRALPCESLVDCQRACADEARFHCESFNYKLDPSNRGKGLCELMEKPIEHLDLEKDFVEDKEYDFYELDRNSLQPDCALTWPGVPYPSSGFLGGHIRPQYNWQSSHQSGSWPWASKFEDEERYNRFNTKVKGYNRIGFDTRRHYNNPHGSLDRRRGYWDNQNYQKTNYFPNKRTPVGFDKFVPYQIAGGRSEEETWGRYGGSYGTNQEHGREYKDSYDYWGLGEVDNTQYHEPKRYPPNEWDVRSYPGLGGRDFNYGSLGRQNWDGGNYVESFSYGHGNTGHGSQWSYQKGKGSSPVSVSESETTEGHGYEGHSYGGYDGVDHSYGHVPNSINDRCSSRRRAGAGLGSRAVRLSLRVHDVLACERACFQQVSFKCVSYSFRYSKQDTENCFLSEVPYKGLDLTTDSGSDVYTMQDSSCQSPSHKPWFESECFWHVRAGRKLTHNAINARLITSGLGACEAECIRSHNFVCRAFSFRFGSPTIGDDPENCLLTSLSSTELADSWNSLEASEGHELYARGSFGRGCEPTVLEEIAPANKEEQCYLQYDSTARLLPPAVQYPTYAKDSHSCRAACSKARLDFEQSAARAKRSFSHHHASPTLVRCMSFSFSSDRHIQSNCLLSDIRLIDLQLGLDYEHSKYDWLFAFDLLNKECWTATVVPGPLHHEHGHHGYIPDGQFAPETPQPSPPPTIPGLSGPGSSSLKPPHPAPAPDFLVPHSHHHRPSTPVHPLIPTSSSGRPSSHPFKPSGPEVGSVDSGAGGPGYSPHRSQDGYQGYDYFNDEGLGAWSQYTVSGWPCRAGTRCAPSLVTSHWSCELEGGEVGAWDYCCTPEHHCGYSEGFNRPWCYVGPSRDQWRPCNDKYYPYHQALRSSQGYPTPPGPLDHAGRPSEHYGTSGLQSLSHSPGPYHDYDTRPLPTNSGHGYDGAASGNPGHHGHEGYNRNPGYPSDDLTHWDDSFKNGPQSYDPRPGYVRIPTVEGPRVQYQHNSGPPHSDSPYWVPVPPPREHDYLDPSSSGFGTPRYWPVAYLHKNSPPNTSYYNHDETNIRPNDRKEDFDKPNSSLDKGKRPNESNQVLTIDTSVEKLKDDVKNISEIVADGVPRGNDDPGLKEKDGTQINSPKNPKGKVVSINNTETTTAKTKNRSIEGVDDKLEFSDEDIEILNLDDAKVTEKNEKSNLEILASEERQIEALGRLLASRRDSQLIEKRSQNEFDAKNIQIAFESTNSKNNRSKFLPVSKSRPERRGLIQKVPREYFPEQRKEENLSSLEVSETNYQNSAKILNNNKYPTSDLRKTLLNGQVYYDAAERREESDSNLSDKENGSKANNSSELPKSHEHIPFGQRMAKSRRIEGNFNRNSTSPRKARRNYRRNYNPDEVRKRLLKKQSGEVA